MASQIPRHRTIAALAEVWASTAELLATLSPEEWFLPSPLPGWDVRDNVAHLLGTENMLLGRAAPTIDIDHDGAEHIRNDIGAFNEVSVQAMRSVEPPDVLRRFVDATSERLRVLHAMTQQEWDAESFTPAGKDTYGRFMQIRVFDCWLHEQDIRDAVGRPGNDVGLAVEVTLDEMTTAMGFVVGKRAGVGPGNRITFALTEGGVVVREIHVDVGDRATVVSELSGPATTTLTMPIGVMTRRCAGRVGPSDLRDRIEIAGDAEVAEKILANQSYTV